MVPFGHLHIYIYLYIWYAIHTLYSTYTQQTTKDEPFHHPKQKKDLETMQSCWHCSHRPRSPGTTRCRSMSRFVGDGAAPWIPYDIFFGSLVAEGGLVKKRKKTIWRDYLYIYYFILKLYHNLNLRFKSQQIHPNTIINIPSFQYHPSEDYINRHNKISHRKSIRKNNINIYQLRQWLNSIRSIKKRKF